MADYSEKTIGILALQGDYEKHEQQVRALGATPRLVRLPHDLASIDALIIPGGESTTMSILIDRFRLRQPLQQFAATRPIYGTCAGMIMLAANITDNISGVEPLRLMDIDVRRNGYGRQIFSFEEKIPVHLPGAAAPLTATFIRAPRVVRMGPQVTGLASYHGDPILVQQGHLLAASFHNELGSDTTVLQYFLDNFLGDTSNL